MKVPTPGPYSTNNLQFAQSTGREHLVDHRLRRGNDRADHHRVLDEALEEVPERAAARAAREPAVSPYFVPGCRHDVSNSLGKDRALANRGALGKPQAAAPLCGNRPRAPEKGPRGMNGFGLSREQFALLFSVMLVAAAGNTAMQSLLPAIGRELGVADLWVAVAFSLSALLWVAMAPVWAHRADRRGRRALMRLGLIGFIVSMLICGGALAAGLAGLAGGMPVFVDLHVRAQRLRRVRLGLAARGPGLYRGADRRRGADQRARRSGLLLRPRHDHRPGDRAACSSSRRSGLAAPLIAFAAIGALVLAALALRLPDDTPRTRRARADRRLSLDRRRRRLGAGRGERAAPPALARPARAALAGDRRGRRPRPGGRCWG